MKWCILRSYLGTSSKQYGHENDIPSIASFAFLGVILIVGGSHFIPFIPCLSESEFVI